MRLKQPAKLCILALATVVVSPLIAVAKVEQWLNFGEGWFSAFGEALSVIPGRTGACLRLAYYRATLARCGRNVIFSFGTKVNHRPAEIGLGVVIGSFSNIGTATIEDYAHVGSRVSLLSGLRQHETSNLNEDLGSSPPVFERVHVGSKTWIGEGAIIGADVGSRCVVAAGSVVFRPIPDGALAMGNPARVISRDFGNATERKGSPTERNKAPTEIAVAPD